MPCARRISWVPHLLAAGLAGAREVHKNLAEREGFALDKVLRAGNLLIHVVKKPIEPAETESRYAAITHGLPLVRNGP